MSGKTEGKLFKTSHLSPYWHTKPICRALCYLWGERAAASPVNEFIWVHEDWPRTIQKSKIIASKTLFSDLSAKEAASTSAHVGLNKQDRSNCLIPESESLQLFCPANTSCCCLFISFKIAKFKHSKIVNSLSQFWHWGCTEEIHPAIDQSCLRICEQCSEAHFPQ